MVIILDIAGDKGACQPAKHRHERLKDGKMQRDPQAGAAVSAQRGGAYRRETAKESMAKPIAMRRVVIKSISGESRRLRFSYRKG